MAPDYSRFLNDMALLLHEVSLYQVLNSYVESSQFDRATITNIVNTTNPEQIQLYYQIVLKGQDEINLAPDSKTGFEMTIIRLFAFKIGNPDKSNIHNPQNKLSNQSAADDKSPNVSDNQTTVKLSQTESMGSESMGSEYLISPKPRHVDNTQEIKSNTQTQMIEKDAKYQLNEINQQNWQTIFSQLGLKGTARELARNAHIVSNDDNVLVLAIDEQAHAFMTDNAQGKLVAAIKNIVYGQISIQLTCDVEVVKTIAKTEQIKHETQVLETKQQVHQNPFVKHMQENFDAQVIQIKNGQNFLEV